MTLPPAPPPVSAPSPGDAAGIGTVAFIGGGNMARGLIGGLLARGVDPATIRVAEPVVEAREALAAAFGVRTASSAADVVAGADTWVLAVKPQVLRGVCESLPRDGIARGPLVVSIAAGITSVQLTRWLGAGTPAIVRAMPNAPALLGAGVTGLYATDAVDADGRARAQALLSSAGATVWLDDEALIDAVTAVSGSGPAYVFLLAEAMHAAARAEGLPADAADTLVAQTLLGAARMLTESGEDAVTLRRRVTSPGGTTAAAIKVFEDGGLQALVADAIHQAALRGRALAADND